MEEKDQEKREAGNHGVSISVSFRPPDPASLKGAAVGLLAGLAAGVCLALKKKKE